MALAVAFWLLPAGAGAYVRTRTDRGVPVAWRDHCLTLDVYSQSSPASIAGSGFIEAVRAAARPWGAEALDCSGLRIAAVELPAARGPIGFDGHNSVMFKQEGWSCDPAAQAEGEPCLTASTLAVTTVTFDVKTGDILDGDILINADATSASPVLWSNAAAGTSLGHHDLHNTLTHEMGHFIGLEHGCSEGGQIVLDHNGEEVPSCTSPDLPREAREATMFPSTVPGETSKRRLHTDEVEAVCTIYPAATTPARCGAFAPGDIPAAKLVGGCSVAARGSGASSVAAPLLLALGFGWICRTHRRPTG